MNVDALYLKIKEGSVIEYIPDSGRQSIDKTFIKKKKKERGSTCWNETSRHISFAYQVQAIKLYKYFFML